MRWLFWLSAGMVVYTYVGYFVFLRVKALVRHRPVKRDGVTPAVSVVLVVRNEEKSIAEKLQNLLEVDYPAEKCQIVIVSDGSTDGTEAILRGYAQNPRVCAVMNALSSGKAAGLNDAMGFAEGEVVVFTDARQKIERGAVRLLMENFADPEVGCASGELMLGDPDRGESSKGTGLYWRIEKKIRELESESGSVIGATGAFYAARKELVPAVPAGTLLDDVFIPMNVVRQGARVIFDGRARAWDLADLGTDREFSRKVRTLTGNYQLMQMAPWILSWRNPVLLEFVSHKLLRLMVPFALAGILLASIVLKGPIYRIALILQLVFYGLSALGGRGPLARVADAARTFVFLNAAAAVAFVNFVTGRKAAWVR